MIGVVPDAQTAAVSACSAPGDTVGALAAGTPREPRFVVVECPRASQKLDLTFDQLVWVNFVDYRG